MGVEPLRALFEYAGMQFMNRSALPTGDGHPVVIFPGLASDRRSVAPLKELCEELGYVAYDWGLGFNTGPQGDVDEWLDNLSLHVGELASAHDEHISLVGWSLGGIYAREVGKRLPRRVRQVITIGTPFAGSPDQTNVASLYRLLSGQPGVLGDLLTERLNTPPKVPTTSIYSRSDGIVAWQACIQSGDHPQTENIEVVGSHLGLGWNSAVYSILADRLCQPLGAWRPYA